MTAKVKCKCVPTRSGDAASFQDKTYGEGVRVAVPKLKHNGVSIPVSCTVCGAIHQVPLSQNK